MGQLNDGTSYPDNPALEAKAKNLKVTVDHGGYRKTGNGRTLDTWSPINRQQ
jgi:hypothetical protein